jgi:hypothetical protein
MKVSEEQMYIRCLIIESVVREMILNGTIDNEVLVKIIDKMYSPENNEEMEKYSEAIVYAKYGVLN